MTHFGGELRGKQWAQPAGLAAVELADRRQEAAISFRTTSNTSWITQSLFLTGPSCREVAIGDGVLPTSQLEVCLPPHREIGNRTGT